MIHPRHANAFTLIELSIVLVIIGLIVGGVLVGRDLIASSQIRAQVTQIEKIQTSMNTFRVKFSCIPGDCNTATTWLGATGPAGEAINNGNGNGNIDYSSYSSVTHEGLNVFQQLSAARLVDGVFQANTPLNVAMIPNIFPRDKIGRGGVVMWTVDQPGSETWIWTDNNWDASLTPNELFAIDKKIDDGRPASGKVNGNDPYFGPSGKTGCRDVTGTEYNISDPTMANDTVCWGGMGWYRSPNL